MHLSDEQLWNLAKSYVCETLLDDEQVALKRHMAECDYCYERFCTQYVVIKQLLEQGLALPENLEDKSPRKILLTLRSVGKALELLGDRGSFFPMTRIAFARGDDNDKKQAVYKSRISPSSQIYQTSDEIVIQLDDEAFAVENLSVRYEVGGKTVVKQFAYDETTECYAAHIARTSEDETISLDVFETEM